jgi:hypothetical protein
MFWRIFETLPQLSPTSINDDVKDPYIESPKNLGPLCLKRTQVFNYYKNFQSSNLKFNQIFIVNYNLNFRSEIRCCTCQLVILITWLYGKSTQMTCTTLDFWSKIQEKIFLIKISLKWRNIWNDWKIDRIRENQRRRKIECKV